MSAILNVPILNDILGGGLKHGAELLVEFEPHSLWYETSLTIAAQALRNGIETDYHTFQRNPSEIKEALIRFELDVEKLEKEHTLRVIDSYTVQMGMGTSDAVVVSGVPHVVTQSVKLADWSIDDLRIMKTGPSETEKGRLHIDDNTAVLLQYNQEKTMIDYWRTRALPQTRAREEVGLHSLLTRVASEYFYRQFESLCDAIIDFQSREIDDTIEHRVRVRVMRGRPYEPRWRRLKLLDTGEVALAD